MSISPVVSGPGSPQPSKPVERAKPPPPPAPNEEEEEVSSAAARSKDEDDQSVRGRLVDISA